MFRLIRNWLIKRARSCTRCALSAYCSDEDIPAFAFMHKHKIARQHRKIARNCCAYSPEIPEFLDSGR